MIEQEFEQIAVYDTAKELQDAAAEKLLEYQAALEDMHGDILLGIEDEFTIHGIDYREEQNLIDYLTERLSDKYGSLFASIDDEHPLMRVKDSIEAGKNHALHIPNTIRLELVMDHEPEKPHDKSHLVHKAELLTEMRQDILEAIEAYTDEPSTVSWNPRPIVDLHAYLTETVDMTPEEILDDIKEQAENYEGLIGRDRILECETLEELLLDDNAPIDNKGAAGSGVHINIGFVGKEGVNPFYNADDPDSGTPVTWNTSAGIIDVTAESILPFVNLRRSSWNRIGNSNLSASSEARYHPLKKGGAIVKQNPQSKEFYERHGVPYKVAVNEKNAHIEVRHCDGGAGLKDGSSLIMLQLCATLAGMYHGLKEDKIQSYDQLLEHVAPLCQDYDTAVENFNGSKLMHSLLGDRLFKAVQEHTMAQSRGLEEVWHTAPDTMPSPYDEEPDVEMA